MARLGTLERRVMEVLWASPEPEMTGREVADALPGYAYTTMVTVLDRLENKGLVVRTRHSRAHRYAAAGSREGYTAELMHEALSATGDRDAALIRFAETVTSSDATVLRDALRRMTRRSRRGDDR